MALQLTSTAFQPGQTLPILYTCESDNISPPLTWSGVPDNAESLVIVMESLDTSYTSFCHWVVYNLPVSTTSLPENAARIQRPGGGMQGRNGFGNVSYQGPCPGQGPEQRYHIRLYALDTTLDLPTSATREMVMNAVEGHIIGRAEMSVLFAGSLHRQARQ